MRRITLTVCVALLLTFAVRAQTKPDFSGTWAMDPERSESAVQAEPVGPITLVIKQTPAELSVEIKRRDRSGTITSKIYDSERASPPLLSAPHARSYWDGSNLVTELARNIQGETVRTKEVRSVNASATEMTVITTLIVEHGYTLKGTQNYGTGKDVYTKKVPEHR